MAIAWRDGTTAIVDAATSFTLTVPSDVAAGDVVFFQATAFNGTPGTTISASSGGTTPAQSGATLYANNGSIYAAAALFWFVATSADAGKIITITTSVSSYSGASLGAWSGCGTSQPDVQAQAGNGGATSFAAPSATTAAAGDWAAWFVGSSDSGANQPSGTLRELDGTKRSSIMDSNGSVGGSGTAIPGGSWTDGSSVLWAGFTIGLAPPSSGVTVPGVPSALTLAAPAGSLSVAQPGAVSPLALAAPAGTVQAGAVAAGAVSPLTLAAPAGTVQAGGKATGAVAGLALAAPAGSLAVALPGLTPGLVFAAPPGTVQAGAVVAGITARLALAAPPGTAAIPAAVTIDPDELGGTITTPLYAGAISSDDYAGSIT